MPRRKGDEANDPLYGNSREQVLRRQEITAIVWQMMLDGLSVKDMEAAFKEPKYARYESFFRHSDVKLCICQN